MNIYIDESGSFVSARVRNSWNCIAAYMTPQVDRRGMRMALGKLKQVSGSEKTMEVKLRNVSEADYFAFLSQLNRLNGVLFAVATDAGLNDIDSVVDHRGEQASKITEHKTKMQFESGRKGLEKLAGKVRNLAPQLYVQLHCQVNLISLVLHSGVLYFVQRFPKALGAFRWRIDQKNSTQTVFEETFVTILPPILQSISFKEPMVMLKEADYSAFEDFNFPEDQAPTYLKNVYGIDTGEGPSLNIGKLIRDDLKFEDSKTNHGVQVADLLASGLRRCLRGQFVDNQRAASLLGGLMLQDMKNQPPILILGLRKDPDCMDNNVAERVLLMGQASRRMLAH